MPLLLTFDLGSTKRTLGFTSAPAQRPRIRTMPAGNLAALVKEIQLAKARWGLPPTTAVRSCYEAGRDGFWLHRWLVASGGGAEETLVQGSATTWCNGFSPDGRFLLDENSDPKTQYDLWVVPLSGDRYAA